MIYALVRRVALTFFSFLILAINFPAYSAQTTVGSVITTVSPTQPMAGDPYYVTTKLIPGGNGQWCTATVRVTVAVAALTATE